MHWKKSNLGKVSRRLKGKSIGAPIDQLNRFAARQTYRLHDCILSNPDSRRRLHAHQPSSDAQQQRVIEGLETRGVSVLPFTDFFPDSDRAAWERLRAEGARFAERAEAELAERRSRAAAGR